MRIILKPPPPRPVCGGIVFHSICPWCPKGWGLQIHKDVLDSFTLSPCVDNSQTSVSTWEHGSVQVSPPFSRFSVCSVLPSHLESPGPASIPLRVQNSWRRSQFFSQSGKMHTGELCFFCAKIHVVGNQCYLVLFFTSDSRGDVEILFRAHS